MVNGEQGIGMVKTISKVNSKTQERKKIMTKVNGKWLYSVNGLTGNNKGKW